ncbi:MAG: TetR/AcrR family transcriptional regulator [Lachnospira sp.]|nr:TetR/AcrR family transcriptional regulator [Lachnospira sp.]
MKKARRDSILSQESIMDATIQLFCSSHYQDITVTDICKRAGVARVTFYKYFHSIDDLLTTIFKENFIANYKKLSNPKSLENTTILLTFLLEGIYFSPDFINHLVSCNRSYILLDIFDMISEIFLSYQNLNPDILKLQCLFISGGIYNVFIEWIRGGSQITIPQLAQKMAIMLETLVATLARQFVH